MVRTIVAKMKPAGAPIPFPNPTASGVLKSIAEIGADPVTVRNSTPSETDRAAVQLVHIVSLRDVHALAVTTGSIPS